MFGWFTRRPTRAGFVRELQAAVKAGDPGLTMTYDEERFELRFGASGLMHLGNLYGQYEALKKRERAELVRVVANLVLNPELEIPAWGEAQLRILPRVQSRLFVDSVNLAHEATPGLVVPTLPVSEHLVVCLVYDLTDRMMYVNQAQLERWEVTLEAALKVGRNRLWTNSNEAFREEFPGFFVSAWQDNYDASRILLQSLIWQLKVAGEPVALPCDRDHLYVTGSEDGPNLERLLARARTGVQYAVTSQPAVLRDERWEPFAPSGPGWREHLVTVRAGLYADQRELLMKHLGKDVFVPECSMLSHKQKGYQFSFCVVSPEASHTLLPQTDVVMLACPEPLRLEWATFAELLGERLEATDYWPLRWRLRPVLSAEEWARLLEAGKAV